MDSSLPQQATTPSVAIAHVKEAPALRAENVPTGAAFSASLPPQHATEPAVRMPQL